MHLLSSLTLAALLGVSDGGTPPAAAPVPAAAAPGAAAPAEGRVLRRQPLARQPNEARVERVLQALSVRERAAQLLLAYPQIGRTTPVEVGGVVFVGNSLRNVAKAKERIDSSVARARVPPFFAVDMEGGPSNRLKSLASLRDMPAARDLAALDDGEVKRWGRRVGEEMRALGLNLNLAPVLDVAATGHMADNRRSFSGDPDVVVAKAAAYSRGLLEAGVVPIGKHYPGYGDIAGDSDHALVTSDWSRERVLKEAQVFDRLHELLGGVMLANVAFQTISPKPAIMAAELVALAHQRDWITVTDDVSIQLLADAIGGSSEDVLVQSFLAGNDLLLTTAPPDWDKGLDYLGILERRAAGDEEARRALDRACRRVLRLKDRMGLLDGR